VFFDDEMFLAVRRTPEHAAVIAAEEFHVLRPWGTPHVTDENAAQVLAEVARAKRNAPEAAFPLRWEAAALRVQHREREAMRVEDTLARRPDAR